MSKNFTGRAVSLVLVLALGITLTGCGKDSSDSDINKVISANSAADLNSDNQTAESLSNVSENASETDTSAVNLPSTDTKDQTSTQAGELTQEEKQELLSQLVILQDPTMYTYDQMLSDTEILKQLYPNLFTQDSIGTTADGRQLVHYIVGNPDADKQIFINGAIHAREYLTFQLVMKQMVVYMEHVDAAEQYGNLTYKDMWDSVAIHVVPLINPDGVQISQFGLDGIQNESVREEINSIAAADGSDYSANYFDHWKANAQGIDLNRNFDAYWEYYEGTAQPSADHYKGTAPGSAPETAALINLTQQNNFLYTISYHTQGQVIYWCFDNMDSIYDISSQWVNQIIAQTGYTPVNDYSTVDPAGYSDWAIYRCQIPSVVIEVASGDSPYLSDQFQQVWNENLNIWELTVIDAMNR